MPAVVRPGVNGGLGPGGHGHRARAVALAHQVHDHPPSFPLLQMAHFQARRLLAAQAAAQEHGEEGTVAHALDGRHVGQAQQLLGLGLGQPVA